MALSDKISQMLPLITPDTFFLHFIKNSKISTSVKLKSWSHAPLWPLHYSRTPFDLLAAYGPKGLIWPTFWNPDKIYAWSVALH